MGVIEAGKFEHNGISRIEFARRPEDAIEIISKLDSEAGLRSLQTRFQKLFRDPADVSVIPILRSGARLGAELTEPSGTQVNPMRMSYYAPDASRLSHPICLIKPDINKIVTPDGRTKPVVFAECVVDTQGTILASIQVINGMIDKLNRQHGGLSYPEYHTFAYMSKTGNNHIDIPNLSVAFNVHPDIWVGGLGCDLPGGSARELDYIVGILSPYAKSIPRHPYYTPAFKA